MSGGPDIDWSDHDILLILHDVERGRMSFGQVAKNMSRRMGVAVSRSAIAGLVRRINHAHDAIPCTCTKRENQDGGMPLAWWAS